MWSITQKEALLNLIFGTSEPDRPQEDKPAFCVITQQYSSSNFLSMRLYSSKEKKIGLRFKNIILFSFYYYNIFVMLSSFHDLKAALNVK
jgi:hypothetical protein